MSTDWEARLGELQRQLDALEASAAKPPSAPAAAPASVTRAKIADLLLDKAEAYFRLGQREEEHETLLQLIDRFEADVDPDVRVSYCSALRNVAMNYYQPDAPAEAVLYNNKLREFAEHHDARIRCQVIRGMLAYASFLEDQGRHDEEMATYDGIVALFGDDPAVSVREHLASALFCRALTLDRAGQADEGDAAYHALIDTLRGDHDNDPIAWCICKAHVNLLFNTLRESRFKQALHHSQATLALAGARDHAGMQDQIGRALIGAARVHDAMGDHVKELAALDELIGRLEGSPYLVAKAFVADALNRKGRGLVVDFNDRPAALLCYQRVIDLHGETPLVFEETKTSERFDRDHHRSLIRHLAQACYHAADAHCDLLNYDQSRFWINHLELTYGPYDDPQVIDILSDAHDLSLKIERKSSRTNPLKGLFDRSARPGGPASTS